MLCVWSHVQRYGSPFVWQLYVLYKVTLNSRIYQHQSF